MGNRYLLPAILIATWLFGWAGTSIAFCQNTSDRQKDFDVRDVLIPAFAWPAIVVGLGAYKIVRAPSPSSPADKGG